MLWIKLGLAAYKLSNLSAKLSLLARFNIDILNPKIINTGKNITSWDLNCFSNIWMMLSWHVGGSLRNDSNLALPHKGGMIGLTDSIEIYSRLCKCLAD